VVKPAMSIPPDKQEIGAARLRRSPTTTKATPQAYIESYAGKVMLGKQLGKQFGK
jgi:hypothetical protein